MVTSLTSPSLNLLNFSWSNFLASDRLMNVKFTTNFPRFLLWMRLFQSSAKMLTECLRHSALFLAEAEVTFKVCRFQNPRFDVSLIKQG